ncbi:MAG: magnesium transporter [Firmicutes bacterium]|nr:magnesium transporter [Bacillota bacterium]
MNAIIETTQITGLHNRILELIEEKDMKSLKSLLQSIEDNMETLYVINELSDKEKAIVFRLLPKDNALAIFEQLDTTLQKELLSSFTNEYAKELIEELSPDDRVELFDELPAKVTKRLMSLLSPEDRQTTHMLMGYEAETAGRIMTPDFVSLRRNMTAEKALQKVRKQAKEDKETIYSLYITDEKKKLEGVISLRKLLIAEPGDILENIMYDPLIKVSTSSDQEEVAHVLKDYDLLAVPVVDSEDRIVGIVTVDDAMDILEDAETDDMFARAGLADVAGKESDRSEALVKGSIWKILRVRMPYLVFSLLAGIAAGFMMSGFEDTLDSLVFVAFFIPVIMDMGGSVGTQSSTVFARGVALGHIDTRRFSKALLKEIFIGFILSLIVGIIVGAIAWIWVGIGYENSYAWLFGLIVAISLIANMTLAALLGFLIPWILVKLKLDQAAGSAPIITTIKDVLGLLIYFVLVATLMSSLIY